MSAPPIKATRTAAAPSPHRTLEQRRAGHAWSRIEAVRQEFNRQQQDEYAGQAKKMPTRIITSGLGAALAFLLAKARSGTRDEKPHFVRLHHDLTDWVIRQRPLAAARHKDSLLQSVIDGDADFLRLATDEVMAYLLWLNRFAEAQGLGETEGGTDDAH